MSLIIRMNYFLKRKRTCYCSIGSLNQKQMVDSQLRFADVEELLAYSEGHPSDAYKHFD